MKVWIVGMHGSGLPEIMDLLQYNEFSCAKIFTNLPIDDTEYDFYNKDNYVNYTDEDIKIIFENNSHIFMNSMSGYDNSIYEGISLDEFENSSVIGLSYYQFLKIPQHIINDKENLIVWLDNSNHNRINNYRSSGSTYDYNSQELIERECIKEFYQYISSLSNVVYFLDEIPSRVSTIIKTILLHEDMKYDFVQNFD